MEETKTTNQEEQIFLTALEFGNDADRNEYLTNECAGNKTLRNRVEELLSFQQRGDNILDDTSGGLLGSPAANVDSVNVGTQIGPYKLLEEIGVGGMGVVFMAEQSQPVRRKVAVKVIKLGMDTRNVIARFEAERQALAMMDHPNITKVFDAGITTTGRPYFVMELVSGLAITDYCDKEQLSLTARIELFYQVCVGIKHAHQKGIIHRDLKPSNVMVTHYDGVAVPKIIDFGIAKAVDQSLTEKTLFTSYGNMIGTPEYMSPEQAEMSGQDIDTRADVYSLGVLMYELLTSTTPFYHWKKKGIHKICTAICNEEPELASTRVNNLADTVKEISRNRGTDVRSLKRILQGDMDWILAKCMSKSRSDRYESAADLARDVRRYLDGQPVEAVGRNIGYRARKFFNKHRTVIAFATVILATMCAATIVSTVFAIQATKAQKLANNLRLEAEQERQFAETERDRAQAAESKIKLLERRSRNEAATARAIAKFNRELSETRGKDDAVQELKGPSGIATWSGRSSISNPSANAFTFRQVQGENSSENHVIGKSDVKKQVIHVVIGDGGTLNVTNLDGSAKMLHRQHHTDSAHPFVVIEGQQAADDTKRFLNLLVEEQRESFGPDDDVVANTLIEIGDVSLEHKEWSHAENNFREARDILKLHAGHDGRMAKLELLLSKALMNQEKTAAAKETLANTVFHLKKLDSVPDEILEVILELKSDMKDLDFQFDDIGDALPEHLKGHLKMKLNEFVEDRLQFESRKK